MMRKLALGLLGTGLVLAALVAGAITFGTLPPLPPLAVITERVQAQSLEGLPAANSYRARDGAELVYRRYDGDPTRVLLLIHGSTGRSEGMHSLAKGLAAAMQRPTIFSLDIRGHGLSGAIGDIGYIGQLEDDLEDFLRHRQGEHGSAQWTLLGFSAGGGFALRVAGSRLGERFRRTVLLSPMLDPRGPTYRPDGGGWAQPYIPRIVALTALDRIGITWLHGLPAISFARQANGQSMTYSYRLLVNFGVGGEALQRLVAAPHPPLVLVGAKDELFIAEAFAPTLQVARKDTPVTVLPGLGHIDMVFHREAIGAIATALGGK